MNWTQCWVIDSRFALVKLVFNSDDANVGMDSTNSASDENNRSGIDNDKDGILLSTFNLPKNTSNVNTMLTCFCV